MKTNNFTLKNDLKLMVGAVVLLIVFLVVLFLAVTRVQNLQQVLTRPKAVDYPAWCSKTPSCCSAMKTGGLNKCGWPERGECTQAQCQAASDYGDKVCGNTSPNCRCGFFRDQCVGAPSGGGGSGGGGGSNQTTTTTRGCNDSSPADVQSCFKASGNCSGAWACHDDPNSAGCPTACKGGGSGEIKVYIKNADCSAYASQVTVRMSSTSTCSACNSSCNDAVCQAREKVYDPSVGYAMWSSSNKAKYVFVTTGTSLGSCKVDTNSSNDCTIVVGGGSCKNEPKGCTKDSDCSAGQTCDNGTCKAKGEVEACWGNGGSNGRCYDCNGDGEVNILDFSCFRNRWLENIGTT